MLSKCVKPLVFHIKHKNSEYFNTLGPGATLCSIRYPCAGFPFILIFSEDSLTLGPRGGGPYH